MKINLASALKGRQDIYDDEFIELVLTQRNPDSISTEPKFDQYYSSDIFSHIGFSQI